MQSVIRSKFFNTTFKDHMLMIIGFGIFYLLLIAFTPYQPWFEGRSIITLQFLSHLGQWFAPQFPGAINFAFSPLYYWLASFWFWFFGHSLLSLRFLSLVLALGNIIVIYALGKKLWTRRIGLLAAIMLGSALLFNITALLIGPYELGSLCLNLTLYFLLTTPLAQNEKYRRYGAMMFWIFLGTTPFTLGLIGVFIPLAVMLIWSLLEKNRILFSTLKNIPGILLFSLLMILWLVFTYHQSTCITQYYLIDLILQHGAHGQNFFPGWRIIVVLMLAFLPWIIFFPVAIWYNLPLSFKDRSQEPIGILLIVWVVLMLLGFMIFAIPVFWITLLLPVMALMTARYLAPAWDRVKLPFYKGAYEVLFIGVFIFFAYIFTALSRHYVNLNSHEISTFQAWGGLVIFISLIALGLLRYTRFKVGFLTLFFLTLLVFLCSSVLFSQKTPMMSPVLTQYIQKGVVVNPLDAT